MAGGSVTKTEPWEAQQPYLTRGFDRAEQLYKANPLGMPYYGGSTLAGFDPAQTAAQQRTLSYATGKRPAALQSAAESTSLAQMGGLTPFSNQQRGDLLAGNVNTGAGTPFGTTANALQQAVQSNLTGNILPGIRESLVRYNPGGSSRGDLVQNKAISSAVQSGLTKPLADMYSSAYQTAQGQRFPMAQMELDQQARGVGGYRNVMDAPLSMSQAMAGVGADRRAMTQENINRAIAKHDYQRSSPQRSLQNYLASVTGDYGSVVNATQKPNILGFLGNLVGGGLLGG
tara:strand:+ start:122 stop:982 length:861 start_codon:yes stop_codon:yes gene_type:complete